MRGDEKPINGLLCEPHMDFDVDDNPPMDIVKVIAENLTDWMTAHPFLDTSMKVAKRSGVGFGTVQRAKNGLGNLTVINLEAIARAFGKPAAQLITPKEAKQAEIIPMPERTDAALTELLHIASALDDVSKGILLERASILAETQAKKTNNAKSSQ